MQWLKKVLYLIPFIIAALYTPSSYAIGMTTDVLQITTNAFGRSINFTSDTITSTRDKFKLVQAAKSDAAAYVASNGKIQGPYLTKAIQLIRSEFAEANNMNDIELAEAILAVK